MSAISFGKILSTRKSDAQKSETAPKSPIATRGIELAKIQFIRKSSKLKDDEPPPAEAVLIANAWAASPNETMLAFFAASYSPLEIAQKLGFKNAAEPEFQRLVNDAKDYLRHKIAGSLVESVIPSEVIVEAFDSDGIPQSRDISTKLRKAVTTALFDKEMTVSVSIIKGQKLEASLAEIFNKSVDEVKKLKTGFKTEYSRVFRTREVQNESIPRPLPPALAGVIKAS